jgi:hypothetical protein
MRFLLIFILAFPLIGETNKILCELEGTYSVTYKDIKKTYLSEGIELFKNLSTSDTTITIFTSKSKNKFC